VEKMNLAGKTGRSRLLLLTGGGIVIAALVVAGAVLAFGGASADSSKSASAASTQPTIPAATTTPSTATTASSAPKAESQVTPTKAAADVAAATSQTAGSAGTPSKTSDPSSTSPATMTAVGSGGSGQSAGGAGASTAFTANTMYASEYSVPVGSSPVNTRATHPIDLYMPPKDPMFDITKRTEFPPVDSEAHFVEWMLKHTDQQKLYLEERWQRAAKAVDRHHITRSRVLMAFLLTPREWFCRPYNLDKVYENTAIPIGYGQTISGPDLVARMTDYLDPKPNEKVLEIGTGSGYQSAFLSSLSNYVYTIEIVKPLAEETNGIYLAHTKEIPQYANIHRRMADGYYGWPEAAPFDKIIVTTGTDHIPPDLLKELKPGGVMVIPIGPPTGQTIMKITKEVDKDGTVHLTREDIYHGTAKDIFVPFTAAGGGTHYTNKND